MLTSKRSKFTLPANVTYLNCAYMSPLLTAVEKAGIRGLRAKRNPALIKPGDFFEPTEELRKEFARLINVDNPRRIVVIPSVSYGMAVVARNVNIAPHQHVIVAAEQFPSNYYCWKKLCDENGATVRAIAPPKALNGRGRKWNHEILAAINENTKLVAIGHVHWADGTRFDLAAIRKRTREVGALLVIDGTQSVGALPFDVVSVDPDALVVAGYKWLMGPYSIGLAYFGSAFDHGRPIEENWINRKNSEAFSALVNYEENYQDGVLRYEVGEHSNFIHIPMLTVAIRQLNRWGVDRIQEYCSDIATPAIASLREHGFWVEEDAFRASHLFGIRLPADRDAAAIRQRLAKKNIIVSFRGDAIRVSPNVYNTRDDLNRLVNALIS